MVKILWNALKFPEKKNAFLSLPTLLYKAEFKNFPEKSISDSYVPMFVWLRYFSLLELMIWAEFFSDERISFVEMHAFIHSMTRGYQ